MTERSANLQVVCSCSPGTLKIWSSVPLTSFSMD